MMMMMMNFYADLGGGRCGAPTSNIKKNSLRGIYHANISLMFPVLSCTSQ
jgi:hypothetical protein